MARRLARSQESRRALADVGRKYPEMLRGRALIAVNARAVRGMVRGTPVLVMGMKAIHFVDAHSGHSGALHGASRSQGQAPTAGRNHGVLA